MNLARESKRAREGGEKEREREENPGAHRSKGGVSRVEEERIEERKEG